MIDKYVHRDTGKIVYYAGETNESKEGETLLVLVERNETGVIYLTEKELKEQYKYVSLFDVDREDSILQLCEIYKNKYEREHGVSADIRFESSSLTNKKLVLNLKCNGEHRKIEVEYEGKFPEEIAWKIIDDLFKGIN